MGKEKRKKEKEITRKMRKNEEYTASTSVQTPPMWKKRPAPSVPSSHVQTSSSMPPAHLATSSLSPSPSPPPQAHPLQLVPPPPGNASPVIEIMQATSVQVEQAHIERAMSVTIGPINPTQTTIQTKPQNTVQATINVGSPNLLRSTIQMNPQSTIKTTSNVGSPNLLKANSLSKSQNTTTNVSSPNLLKTTIQMNPQSTTQTVINVGSPNPLRATIQMNPQTTVQITTTTNSPDSNKDVNTTTTTTTTTIIRSQSESSPPKPQTEESFKRGETPKKSRQGPIENLGSPSHTSFDEKKNLPFKPQPVTAAPKPAAAGIKFTEMSTTFIGKTSAPKEEELQSFVDSVVQGRADLSHTIDPSELSDKLIRIGSGASGTVFKTLYKGRYVAVKKFSPNNITFDRAEIVREAALMSILDHPNLVEYIGSCLNPRNMFIVTDLYPTNLQSVVFNKALDLTLAHVLRIALGISNGMRFLHSLGLIHRDLKCANILLTSDLDAKITDFGTTRIIPREKAMMTGGMGTLEYMAPEILSHQMYSTKADVFSFAIVLWQMLSRKEPYEDLSIFTIPEHVCKGSRPPLPPGCPHKLGLLIKTCWHSKQTVRPEFAEICRMLQVIAGLSPDTSSATSDYFRKCGVRPPGISATTITELQAGSVLLKCGRSGKPHFSLFQLSDDSTHIQWTSKTKDPSESKMAINSIREMCLGQMTPVFARSGMDVYSHLSFSLITPERSVDIICTTADEFKTWTAGLRTLLPIGARFRSGSKERPESPTSASTTSSLSLEHRSSASSLKVSDVNECAKSPPISNSTTTSSSSSSSSARKDNDTPLPTSQRRRSLSVGSGQQMFMYSVESQRGNKSWSSKKIKATRSEKNVNVYSANMKKVQLTSGGYEPMSLTLIPEMLGKDICHVAAGKLHYAALSIHGTLYMWGDNTFGQQGVPPAHPRSIPPLTSELPPVSSPPSSLASSLSLLAPLPIQAGSCSGNANQTQLQKESSSKSILSNVASSLFVPEILPPHPIPLGTAIVHSVACGKNHTMCMTVDGVVYSWGKNARGELGLGDTTERCVPTIVGALRHTPVIIIACGQGTSAAYTEDGTLYMWGQNDTFQLAQDGGSHIATPSVVQHDFSTPQRPQPDGSEDDNADESIFADEPNEASSPSTASASLAVFRKNIQLAKRIKNTAHNPEDESSITEQVEEIALGQYHSAVLTTFGTIWVWGKLGSTIERQPKITRLPNGVGGVQISSGDYHMAAIGDDEQIYTWGDGNLGQLGRGISEFSSIPKPVIGPFSKMKPQQVFCSGSYTMVVTEEGNLYGFGYGSAGKWSTTEESLPNLLTAFKSKNVLRMGCGPNEMLAIVTQRDTPDRRLTGWIPDSEAKCCMACKEQFTTIKRRHHCRKCEGVFCGNCSRYRTPILSKGFAKPVRVCLNCFSILTTLISKI